MHESLTRNIRKPGDVGKLNFCTFTQNRNGLIGLNSSIPYDTIHHTLCGT